VRKKRQQQKQEQKEQQKQAEIKQRQELKALKKKVSHLVETLGETKNRPLLQIERIIERIGIDFALEKLAEAEQVEAQGGLLLPDNSRRRTKGGVFFFLVKQHLKEQEQKEHMKVIFYRNQTVASTLAVEDKQPEENQDHAE
jgi:hypothetical protein